MGACTPVELLGDECAAWSSVPACAVGLHPLSRRPVSAGRLLCGMKRYEGDLWFITLFILRLEMRFDLRDCQLRFSTPPLMVRCCRRPLVLAQRGPSLRVDPFPPCRRAYRPSEQGQGIPIGATMNGSLEVIGSEPYSRFASFEGSVASEVWGAGAVRVGPRKRRQQPQTAAPRAPKPPPGQPQHRTTRRH